MIHFFLSFETLAYIVLIWAVSLVILALRLQFDAEFKLGLDEIADKLHSIVPGTSVELWQRVGQMWVVVLAPYAALMTMRTLVRRAIKKLF